MATNWVCPIDGAVPADNGTNQTPTGNQIGSTDTHDINGFPYHCPLCGSGMIVASATLITTETGVASGSQHPIDIDTVYVTSTDAASAQLGGTSRTIVGGPNVLVHTFAKSSGVVNRGTATVTPETVNSTVGP